VANLDEIGRDYLPGLIGIVFDDVEDGVVRSHLELRQALFAPNGFVHAGAVITLADTACGYGCMLLAVQADGSEIETVEGLADGDRLTALQQAFTEHHALQCGYCTPGMLMSATALLRANPSPSDEDIRKALQGNICRCTGYWNIFEAVKSVAR